MRVVVTAFALLCLSGCAASVTKRGLAANAEGEKVYASCEQEAASRGIDAIKEKTNFFHSGSMTLSMLTNRDFATEQEKIAIANLWESWRLCGERIIAFVKTHYNEDIAALYRMDINRQLVQLANLYNGDVKWSMFNVDMQIYDNKFGLAVTRASQEFWRDEYAEAERRQAAIGAALQAYGNALKDYGNTYNSSLRNQPAVQQAPIYDPVRTSCRDNGNRITCTQSSDLMTSPKLISCRVNGNVMTCTEQ